MVADAFVEFRPSCKCPLYYGIEVAWTLSLCDLDVGNYIIDDNLVGRGIVVSLTRMFFPRPESNAQQSRILLS